MNKQEFIQDIKVVMNKDIEDVIAELAWSYYQLILQIDKMADTLKLLMQ